MEVSAHPHDPAYLPSAKESCDIFKDFFFFLLNM